MRQILSILFLLISLNTFSQQVVMVKGTLTDPDGYPLPGVNVILKGTTTGTISDIDGNYQIQAPVGATLVFSFIGFVDQEMIVQADGTATTRRGRRSENTINIETTPTTEASTHRYISRKPAFPSDEADSMHKPALGSAILSKEHTYHITNSVYHTDFSRLEIARKKDSEDHSTTRFKLAQPKIVYPISFQFNTSYAINSVAHLPALQNIYAQGRSIGGQAAWQGPETGEQFAWGPKISLLEYDGSDYDYHRQGRLVSLGTGNGVPARSYSATDLFRHGKQWNSSLRISQSRKKYSYYLACRFNTQEGIVPLSKFRRNTVEVGGSYFPGKLEIDGSLTHSRARSIFHGSAPFGYQLIRSLLLTPPTFDNSNGLDHEATNQGESYLLSNGSQRSGSLNNLDNPYWILNRAIDELSEYRTNAGMDLKYRLLSGLYINLDISLSHLSSHHDAGFASGSFIFPTGKFSNRSEEMLDLNSGISLTYEKYIYPNQELKVRTAYSITRSTANVARTTTTGQALLEYPENQFHFSPIRQEQNYQINANYSLADILLVAPKLIRMNVSDAPTNAYWGGSLGSALKLHNLFNLSYHPLNFAKIRFSTGKTYQMHPLILDASPYSTLSLAEDQLATIFPTLEITPPADLSPERITDLNAGLDLAFFHHRLNLDLSWFRKHTDDAVLGFFDGEAFQLQNLASLKSSGTEISLNLQNRYGRFSHRWEFSFTQFQTTVESLYNGHKNVPLAGFSFVSTQAIEGQPLGVIQGTRFLRNEEGKKIIGPDGFPLADTLQGIIGDPNPDWLLGLHSNIIYQGFTLEIQCEYKKGGQVWNGTKNTLNYYGLSAETGAKRNTSDFLFEGVMPDNTPNTTPVDFFDPGEPVSANRWTRYGQAGIAEEAIEDASWFRIRKIRLSYEFSPNNHRKIGIDKLQVSAFVSNLLTVTPYSGVDPESALLGNASGSGLDYFNMPSTKSYGLALKAEF